MKVEVAVLSPPSLTVLMFSVLWTTSNTKLEPARGGCNCSLTARANCLRLGWPILTPSLPQPVMSRFGLAVRRY